MKPRSFRAFSLLELLVSVAVIVVLLGLLLPLLIRARDLSYQTVCANNLRQLNAGWQAYLQDHKEQFPRHGMVPDWAYGGAEFVGADRVPVLAASRPINPYVAQAQPDDALGAAAADVVGLFRCPADAGVADRAPALRGQARPSILPAGTCFNQFGTSYRANPYLLDSTLAGIDGGRRALTLSEIQVDPSRLLLTADPAWWYATRERREPEARLEATWHKKTDAGNMLAVDGSIRFMEFAKWPGAEFALNPRPDLGN